MELYAAELMIVTDEMRGDPCSVIISDGATFLVCTLESKANYPELEFWQIDDDAIQSYASELQTLKS